MHLHLHRDESRSGHLDLVGEGDHPWTIDLVTATAAAILVVGFVGALVAHLAGSAARRRFWRGWSVTRASAIRVNVGLHHRQDYKLAVSVRGFLGRRPRLFAGAATLVWLSQGLTIASAAYWGGDTAPSSAKPVGRVTATTKDNPLRVSLRHQRGRIGRIFRAGACPLPP